MRVMRSRRPAPLLAANWLPVWRRSWEFSPGRPSDSTACGHPASLLKLPRRTEPTPYAVELISRAKASGAKLAIVSNNAQKAVVAYLVDNGLLASIDNVRPARFPIHCS